MNGTDDRVFDLAEAARDLREEAAITGALLALARQALRGQRLPRKARRLMADAERAARLALEHARTLDDMIAMANGTPAQRA